MPAFTPELRAEYQRLYDTVEVREHRRDDVAAIANELIASKPRYEVVAQRVGVPWQLVAVIHEMEASQKFTRHLHNGDPLGARTVRVPAGHPRSGHPPFTWEESAADALRLKDLDDWGDWSVPGTLYQLERYNGWGYRNREPEVRSPYLWSFCQHYTRGKYVADGEFSATAVSGQCGAAVLLRHLEQAGHPLPPRPQPVPLPDEFRSVRYDPDRYDATAEALQRWLNQHPGVALVADGKAGRRTSNALHFVTGNYLPGDPRA